eukprot:SAG31_NODE_240_length_19407_cov_29.686140_19_plen_120_part_00
MLVSVGFLKMTVQNFRDLRRELPKLDAKFKFVHARMKLCAESIALFGGGERERQIVDRRFAALLQHDWVRISQKVKFRAFEGICRSQRTFRALCKSIFVLDNSHGIGLTMLHLYKLPHF